MIAQPRANLQCDAEAAGLARLERAREREASGCGMLLPSGSSSDELSSQPLPRDRECVDADGDFVEPLREDVRDFRDL